jgi:hypothetical protein
VSAYRVSAWGGGEEVSAYGRGETPFRGAQHAQTPTFAPDPPTRPYADTIPPVRRHGSPSAPTRFCSCRENHHELLSFSHGIAPDRLCSQTKKMKNPPLKTALLFLLLTSVLAVDLRAVDTPLPAAPTKYVTDNASVLHAYTADRLSGQLADFYRRTTDELIVVIIPNLPKGISIGEYARQLYDGWKIGKRGNDAAALLLISTQDHQGRIHAGRGLATKLTEDVCRKIFLETIAPRLDAGDYDGACKAAVNALIAAAS